MKSTETKNDGGPHKRNRTKRSAEDACTAIVPYGDPNQETAPGKKRPKTEQGRKSNALVLADSKSGSGGELPAVDGTNSFFTPIASDGEGSAGEEGSAGLGWKRKARQGDRAKCVFLTWSNTTKPEYARPCSVSRRELARMVQYTCFKCGAQPENMYVFQEPRKTGALHYHVLVEFEVPPPIFDMREKTKKVRPARRHSCPCVG